jgi:kynurenine formamidase
LETVFTAGREFEVYDLSQRLSNRTTAFEPNPHRIEYVHGSLGVERSERRWGLGAEYWPDGQAMNTEVVTLATHSGTHVDAPIHYGPPKGAPITIDGVPLRWCIGDGVRLDMRHKKAGESIHRADVEAELKRLQYSLKPYDIVLVMTGTDRRFEEPGYDQMHPGLRRDATEFLVDSGVRLIGIDAWGLDRPFDVMVREARGGNKDQLWESHVLGRTKPYCQIEKLCNLDAIPVSYGFTVVALPISLEGASAGWARVVAIVWK